MPPVTPPLNPSQTVERIREIIVGRHLDRLEQRVVRLESSSQPGAHHGFGPLLEDRLVANEARLEALQDNVSRLADANREATEQRVAQFREETQRLAAQVQQVAAMKSTEAVAPAIHQLEQKIGTWLSDWQNAFHGQLNARDSRLATQLRSEVAGLWENIESQVTRLESRLMDRELIEERFRHIATAARALAECASPAALNGSGPDRRP